jgi:hypothetical protein
MIDFDVEGLTYPEITAIESGLMAMSEHVAPEAGLALVRTAKALLLAHRARLTGEQGPYMARLDLPDWQDALAHDLDNVLIGVETHAGRALERGGGEALYWLALVDVLRAELGRKRRLARETLSL